MTKLQALTGGILLLDKEQGISSARALGELKRQFRQVGYDLGKSGHAGTLDPMATGLLVCFVGGITKLCKFAQSGRKVYTGEIELGAVSDTDDATGEVSYTGAAIPGPETIRDCVKYFKGEIEQTPPAVSAIKVKGKRSYALARAGCAQQLNARKVIIYDFQISKIEGKIICFKIECSKGTYIRSIARDIGKLLGTGALLKSLCRTQSFPFSLSEARSVSMLGPSDLLSWERLFPEALQCELEEKDAGGLYRGNEQTLRRLENESFLNVNESKVIYKKRGSSIPLGLLEKNEAGKWTLGFNVPFGASTIK